MMDTRSIKRLGLLACWYAVVDKTPSSFTEKKYTLISRMQKGVIERIDIIEDLERVQWPLTKTPLNSQLLKGYILQKQKKGLITYGDFKKFYIPKKRKIVETNFQSPKPVKRKQKTVSRGSLNSSFSGESISSIEDIKTVTERQRSDLQRSSSRSRDQ
mmetsp:Transcript_27170/g.26836  ORF Transcript_27170/g.26836 Transcript_27170/m.26836 type:complete len:158 (+) Transcript_27170:697-1170(+)